MYLLCVTEGLAQAVGEQAEIGGLGRKGCWCWRMGSTQWSGAGGVGTLTGLLEGGSRDKVHPALHQSCPGLARKVRGL